MKIRSLAIAGLFALSIASVNASTLVERFTTDPTLDGWQVFGDTNFFQWDANNQKTCRHLGFIADQQLLLSSAWTDSSRSMTASASSLICN